MEKIYKYTSLKSSIKILGSNAVALNNPQNYNDPFDSVIDFDDKDIYQKEYDKIYNKLIKKYPPEKAEILAKQKLYTKGF